MLGVATLHVDHVYQVSLLSITNCVSSLISIFFDTETNQTTAQRLLYSLPHHPLPPLQQTLFFCFPECILVSMHTPWTGMTTHTVHTAQTSALSVCSIFSGNESLQWWRKPGYLSQTWEKSSCLTRLPQPSYMPTMGIKPGKQPWTAGVLLNALT